MKRPSAWSIRTTLLVVVALALAPSRGLGIYTTWELHAQARAEALGDAMRLARATSTASERLFEGAKQILTVLARLPEVRERDAGCGALFADLLRPYPQVSNLGAATPDGHVFCSGVPVAPDATISDRSYFERALTSKRFSYGEYRVGQVTGKAIINFALPVLDGAGEVAVVVFAGLDLSWLSRVLAEARLPENSTITAVDRLGQVLARYPDAERWVGKAFPDAPFVRAAAGSGDEGTVEGPGLDGTQRLYAFTPLRAGGEHVALLYVGIPSDSAFARVNRVADRALLGFVLVLVLALLVTLVASRMLIQHPVDELVRALRRIGAGDLAARTGLAHTRSEWGRLAAALDEMAERLASREAAPPRRDGP